ncbi:MAG: hypothetical protein LBF62_06755 [Tannerellaceae bacterium]|jgi:hypothetical protein|nr:hypothetical protein [Tannerellaceae bacterium]
MITRKQNTDFGVVLTLALLLIALLCKEDALYKVAVTTLFMTALLPVVYTPLSYLWYGLARLGERFFSAILLAVVFYLLITPVGFCRRRFTKRPCFKKSRESVFVVKDKTYAVQSVTEEALLNLATTARQLSGCENLVMAGGVALNCVANGLIEKSNIFSNYWVQPAAGDAGGALGAALAVRYIYLKEKRVAETPDGMSGACFGPALPEKEITNMIRKNAAVAVRLEDEASFLLCESFLIRRITSR